jgi:hypothetical protein
MKKPWFLRGIRNCGGWGFAPTTIDTVLFSGQGAFSSPCQGCEVPLIPWPRLHPVDSPHSESQCCSWPVAIVPGAARHPG